MKNRINGNNRIYVCRRAAALGIICIIGLILSVLIFRTALASFLSLDFLEESRTYTLNPLGYAGQQFEDTELYDQIFEQEAKDVIRYVALRTVFETNGSFDAQKEINVREYAKRFADNTGNADALYTVEDLINWSKQGFSYSNRVFSLSDFVTYFGDPLTSENFNLDEDGQLTFGGFNRLLQTDSDSWDSQIVSEYYEVPVVSLNKDSIINDIKYPNDIVILENGEVDQSEQSEINISLLPSDPVLEAMMQKTRSELYELVFSYIMASCNENIEFTRESDGMTTVTIKMLNVLYDTTNDVRLLVDLTDNWQSYFALINDIVLSANSLSSDYDVYKKGTELYREGASNIKYIIRMQNGDTESIYTNAHEYREYGDEGLTELVSENLDYVIYFPNSLEYATLSEMKESVLDEVLLSCDYAYSGECKIWICVSQSFDRTKDAFYQAYSAYESGGHRTGFRIWMFVILGSLFILCYIYCLFTVGRYKTKDHTIVNLPFKTNECWSELIILAFLLGDYILYRIGKQLFILIQNESLLNANVISSRRIVLENTILGIWGAFVTLLLVALPSHLIWKKRSHGLIRYSFLHAIVNLIRRIAASISRQRNITIHTLIPYNVFILVNLFGAISFALLWEKNKWYFLILVAIVALDAIWGVFLFRKSSEEREIIDAICRIRDGELDFRLDSDGMSEITKEMAEAVNTIGEGIRNAVDTSMRDERMKSELITNVSHDLKTPLTSIINYVHLLKREQISNEQATAYIQVLDEKSIRLKALLDDLLEASKISSGNIELNLQKLNLAELMEQTIAEYEDRFVEQNLQIVFNKCEHPYIYADGSKLWRVLDNLFLNIVKYALPGTRVFAELKYDNNRIVLEIKNISGQPSSVQGEDLTERFIRGDQSRTTEGSGLGLFIAKSLVEAQSGSFQVQVEADLFKAILSFKEYT